MALLQLDSLNFGEAMSSPQFWTASIVSVVVALWLTYIIASYSKKLVGLAGKKGSKSHQLSEEEQTYFKKLSTAAEGEEQYDAVVIGASVAGCAVAKRLCDQGKKVLVVERDLARPDRIVGELLQPGGIDSLRLLGMESCATDVGQVCQGYVAFSEGEKIQLPYAQGFNGCSFHFGDFVMNLRTYLQLHCTASRKPHSGGCVHLRNATASEVLIDPATNRAFGLRYKASALPEGFKQYVKARQGKEGTPVYTKNQFHSADTSRPGRSSTSGGATGERSSSTRRFAPASSAAGRTNNTAGSSLADESAAQSSLESTLNFHEDPSQYGEKVAKAPLVVLCDGSGSNFRKKLSVNADHQDFTPHSHFVGVILKDLDLPYEGRGHVFLGQKGPILCYRLDPGEVRILVDYKGPTTGKNKLPTLEVVQKWMQESISPDLPPEVRSIFDKTIADVNNIRSMPTPYFTQLFPKHRSCVGIGDHANQRHPLTGGGMTCALRDAIELTFQLSKLSDKKDLEGLDDAIETYTKTRTKNVGCINILSWALYYVFEGPIAMRRACFHYFFLGGDSVKGPMSMLSGLHSSVMFLLYHYTRVMIYGAYLVMINDPSKPLKRFATIPQRLSWFVSFFISPSRIATTLHLILYATRVFLPLVWNEFLQWRRFV